MIFGYTNGYVNINRMLHDLSAEVFSHRYVSTSFFKLKIGFASKMYSHVIHILFHNSFLNLA
ncbi:hypothetical protein CW304_16775 [Bacillus sp. UFRGS-B20]|nr:hypothetical protein CW304_16775 [Bacillus sp. UFRGS-B20]